MKFVCRVLGVLCCFCTLAIAQANTYVLSYGINDYPGDEEDLHGCINDVNELQSTIHAKFNVPTENMKSFLDSQANLENFSKGVTWLVDNAKSGDQVIFQYSGHGAQLDTTDLVTEPDGKDEVIVLADEKLISGKFFKEIGEDFKSRGIDITFVMDSCYSGGLSRDVQAFEFHGKSHPIAKMSGRSIGNVSGISRFKKADQSQLKKLRTQIKAMSKDRSKGQLGGSTAFYLAASENKPSSDLEFKDNKTPAHGAFTYILLLILNEAPETPMHEGMKAIQEILLKNKFEQGPFDEYSTDRRGLLPLVMKPSK